MTIELNVFKVAKPQTTVEKLNAKPIQEKTILSSDNGFRFEFGKGSPSVKAVVARRRPTTKNPTNSLSSCINKGLVPKLRNNDVNSLSLPSENRISINTKSISEISVIDKNQKDDYKSPTNGDSLMLNVYTGPAKDKVVSLTKEKSKFQLKRLERNNKKLCSKESTRKLGSVAKTNENSKHVAANDLTSTTALTSSETKDNKVEQKHPKRRARSLKTSVSVQKVGLFSQQQHEKIPIAGQRLVKPIVEKIFSTSKVESLGLHPHAVKNLADLLSITQLTTVQEKTIPRALEGHDLLVRSQTGSGKTLAYALPIVEKLQTIRPQLNRESGIRALIIVPSRELAIQTYELFIKLLKPYTWLVPGVLMGGEKRKAEKARLRKGINILVGTPGRLVDHLLHTTTFRLEQIQFLILDEADCLLDMGYERNVKEIIEAIDKQRSNASNGSIPSSPSTIVPKMQRMLLSATLTAAVQRLAGLTLQEPIFIDNSDDGDGNSIKKTGSVLMNGGYSKDTIEAAMDEMTFNENSTGTLTIPESLKLNYIVVPTKLRLVSLSGLLAEEYKGREKFKVIVFMSTMEMVNFHHDLLNEQLTQKILDEDDEEMVAELPTNNDEPLLKGLRFFRLHGSMSQTERQGVFSGFRKCNSGVLLATDVMGRGIDLPDIDLVIQYSPPQKIADFVHRVGRSARAGRSGHAILFLASSEIQFVRHLEDKRIRITQLEVDKYLEAIKNVDSVANTVQEAASHLQHRFEELIAEDKEMHDKACRVIKEIMVKVIKTEKRT